MKYPAYLFIFFLICIALILPRTGLSSLLHSSAPLLPIQQAPALRILLLPLDSRPPCLQFVIDAAKIANIELVTPPQDILDYYTEPANRPALRSWVEENISSVDAAILSIDQLTHGGLLAARENTGNTDDENQALLFLTHLHETNPTVPLYTFHVLPRLQPPASMDSYEDRKNLIKYSRLLDELTIFNNPEDLQTLRKLEEKIPEETRQKYSSIYKNNTLFNEKLLQMTNAGIMHSFLIGQDDSEDFGLPNIEKRQLQADIAQQNSSSQILLTRGADEIALMQLAQIYQQKTKKKPFRVWVEYNTPEAAGILMPFMSGSVESTVRDKISALGGTPAPTSEEADFTLFVYIGNETLLSSRKKSCERLQTLLNEGKFVALVDLSEHFRAEETLFPHLIQSELPLNQLIAYAGWNTTSNAVGTALSQAVLFCTRFEEVSNQQEKIELYRHNLTFLNNRFLEDYYYLKDLIDTINANLKKSGIENVYDLDINRSYRFANELLAEGMNARISYLKNTKAYQKPVRIKSREPILLHIKDLQADAFFPWPRTFEIRLESTLYLEAPLLKNSPDLFP